MRMTLLSPRQNGSPAPHGPPYESRVAILGGLPNVSLDVPITSVFTFLFLLGAIGHMTMFQVNKRRGRKFVLSGALFGFSMLRILTCSLRIGWAAKPNNVSLGISAAIFVAFGDIVGWNVNLVLTQRILKGLNPRLGWHPAVKIFFTVIYCLIFISLCLLVGFVVDSYYTLDKTKIKHSRDVTFYATTYFAFTAILPIPLLLAVLCISRRHEMEPFGTGSLRSKIMIVIFGSAVLALGAWFRVITSYLPPRPVSHPARYQSKACYYVFYYTLEVLYIYSYFAVRFDKRFHVPEGSKGPGDYSKAFSNEKDEEETTAEDTTSSREHTETVVPGNEKAKNTPASEQEA